RGARPPPGGPPPAVLGIAAWPLLQARAGGRRRRSRRARRPALRVAEDLAGCIVPAGAHDAAPRVGGRAAQVEPLQRRAVVSEAGKRTHEEELVERHRPLEDVASGEPEALLDVLGG